MFGYKSNLIKIADGDTIDVVGFSAVLKNSGFAFKW